MNKNNNKNNKKFIQGVTLIELVISIVIISIAVTGIMMLFIGTTKSSADPMVRAQALAIAQSYVDEIIMQPYVNDGPTSGRANYNEVDDYNAITSGSAIEDQFGNSIPALAAYRAEVQVENCNTTICSNPFNSINAKKITVNISHSGLGIKIPLTAYRTDY